jgi:hypothetical protein
VCMYVHCMYGMFYARPLCCACLARFVEQQPPHTWLQFGQCASLAPGG